MTNRLQCIVLIDDNEADNYFHKRAILEAKCAEQVICFDMANEALEEIRSARISPNLIFLDINMPGMDGWEFLEEYARLPEAITRAVVVVMLTTSLNPEDKKQAETLTKLAAYCQKPLTAAKVVEIVQKHFGEK